MLSTICPAASYFFGNLPPTSANVRGFSVLDRRGFTSSGVALQQMVTSVDSELSSCEGEDQLKLKWPDLRPDITEQQMHAISQLPYKMTRRCKALMKQVICYSAETDLTLLLNSWVKIMKPKRADWLVVLKEMKRIESPLLLQVMKYALEEESFEVNIRDYTKIIDAYAKQNRLHDAETAFSEMKQRGFACDQVTLTVLVHMYAKAGNLDRAKETFEEIKLLGKPVDKRAYGAMTMAYVRADLPELGEELLWEMDNHETYACREVYKALLRAYSSRGNTDGAQRVFDAIQLAGIVPDAKICALLINAYCVAGRVEDGRSILGNMRSAGLKPNDKCVALIIGAYEKENKLEAAMSLLTDLDKDGVAVGKEATEIVVKWLDRMGLADEAAQLLC